MGMTREEAIDIIKCLAWHTRPNEEDVEQAIKALEQEPYEDCVSRKETISMLEFMLNNFEDYKEALKEALDRIRNTRSVQPTRIHAKWIHGICSNCKYDWGKDAPIASVPNYCPNCGAKMESEDRNERS